MVIIRKKHKETAEEKEARLQREQEQASGIQDQYQARGFELVSFVQANKVFVGVLIAFLVACGAFYSAYLYYQSRSAEIASAAYIEAAKPLEELSGVEKEDREKFKEAQALFQDVVKNHKGSSVAVLANLQAAHLALENDDAKTAETMYKSALDGLKNTDPLYPMAMIGLGYAEEKLGNTKSALDRFEAVVALKGKVAKDLALYEAARVATELKETDRAQKNIDRLKEEFPASVYEKNALRLKEVRI